VLVLDKVKPDLVLLDLMLPGLSGEEVLPRIKGIPVIVVSAKVDIDNKVDLLLGGAADYVTKPFEIKELLARIAIQLRNSSNTNARTELKFDDIVLDIDTHIVKVNDMDIKLTRTEYAILKLLMQSPSQVVTKSQLLDNISLDTPDCTESSLKTHISHLRSKLREVGNKEYIEAVWGIGFKMK
jgi:DNA-binding response OmpR family regulator